MQTAPVDRPVWDDTYLHALGAAQHAPKEHLALFGRALLRVVQETERTDAVLAETRVVEQHAGDDERPGQGTPPCLVRTRDPARAELPVEPQQVLSDARPHGRRG